MAELAIIGSDIQEVLGTAIALNILFNIPLTYGVIITIILTFLLLLIQIVSGMRTLEIIFGVFILIMAICFFTTLIYTKPDVLNLCKGIVYPSFNSRSISPAIALIGSLLMPHNLYLHSKLVLTRKINRQDSVEVKSAIRYFSIESGISLFVSYLINLTVISTFAQFSKMPDKISILTAAYALQKLFGKVGKVIWGLGLLASGQSSTMSGTLAGQYVMEGFLNLKISKFQRALLTRIITIGPSIILIFISNPHEINEKLNILQAIQLPFVVIPLLRIAFNKEIMGKFSIGKIQLGIMIMVALFLLILNIISQLPEESTSSTLTFIFYIYLGIYLILQIWLILTPMYNTTNDPNNQTQSESSEGDIEIQKFNQNRHQILAEQQQ